MKDHLTTLPFELLCCIFALLPLSKEKVQAQLVNKACKAALSDRSAYSADTMKDDVSWQSVPRAASKLPLACLKLIKDDVPSARPLRKDAKNIPGTVEWLLLTAADMASCPVLPAVKHLMVDTRRSKRSSPFPSHKFPALETLKIFAGRVPSRLLRSDFSSSLSYFEYSGAVLPTCDVNVPSGCQVFYEIGFPESRLPYPSLSSC